MLCVLTVSVPRCMSMFRSYEKVVCRLLWTIGGCNFWVLMSLLPRNAHGLLKRLLFCLSKPVCMSMQRMGQLWTCLTQHSHNFKQFPLRHFLSCVFWSGKNIEMGQQCIVKVKFRAGSVLFSFHHPPQWKFIAWTSCDLPLTGKRSTVSSCVCTLALSSSHNALLWAEMAGRVRPHSDFVYMLQMEAQARLGCVLWQQKDDIGSIYSIGHFVWNPCNIKNVSHHR